jgi:two-component sensor histidine kinase
VAGTASRWARRTGQAVLARHSLAGSLGWTVLAVAAPTLLRFVLDAGRHGTPFVTYYPAVVLSALFLGWRFALLTTILCAAMARLLFMQGVAPLGSTVEGVSIFGLFVLSCTVLISIGEWLRRVLTELDAASAREALLNQELRHRLKNLLAVVNSLSALSHRHSDPEQAQNAFAERLAALDRATSLLGAESALACALPELAEEALRPFLADYDIRLTGVPQQVDRDGCVPAVLALHELATNAIKYGALSAPGGWVELGWSGPADGQVTMHWREQGGPPVAKPQRRGMGSRILSMRSPAATFAIAYPADGVRCQLALKAI